EHGQGRRAGIASLVRAAEQPGPASGRCPVRRRGVGERHIRRRGGGVTDRRRVRQRGGSVTDRRRVRQWGYVLGRVRQCGGVRSPIGRTRGRIHARCCWCIHHQRPRVCTGHGGFVGHGRRRGGVWGGGAWCVGGNRRRRRLGIYERLPSPGHHLGDP